MIKKTILLTIIEVSISFFIYKFNSFWILYGSIGTISALLLMSTDIKKMAFYKKIPNGYFVRYAIYAFILFTAALVSKIALILSFIGLINLKIVPFITNKNL
ncbi:hypothetical protein [Tepiditoga spiralis]|nr:hypothetical protein [Tepiditoga spiralis]